MSFIENKLLGSPEGSAVTGYLPAVAGQRLTSIIMWFQLVQSTSILHLRGAWLPIHTVKGKYQIDFGCSDHQSCDMHLTAC